MAEEEKILMPTEKKEHAWIFQFLLLLLLFLSPPLRFQSERKGLFLFASWFFPSVFVMLCFINGRSEVNSRFGSARGEEQERSSVSLKVQSRFEMEAA